MYTGSRDEISSWTSRKYGADDQHNAGVQTNDWDQNLQKNGSYPMPKQAWQ
jgi:hypothetical protein